MYKERNWIVIKWIIETRTQNIRVLITLDMQESFTV